MTIWQILIIALCVLIVFGLCRLDEWEAERALEAMEREENGNG